MLVGRSTFLAASPLMALLWPLAARAGETPCWYEAGVVVVPAEVAGVAGDYVLDTGAPATMLNETQAQGAGLVETQLKAGVRLAGLTLSDRAVAVTKLDARFKELPTPVAGVIGADLLRDLVTDVRFTPCRVGLWPPGAEPPFPAGPALALEWRDGRPTAHAAVADDKLAFSGAFSLSTGSDTAVRLRDDLAAVPGAASRDDLYPYGRLRARLRALSFADELIEKPRAGLVAAPFGPEGEIGAPALSRFRLRFDFPARRLRLAKEKTPTDR